MPDCPSLISLELVPLVAWPDYEEANPISTKRCSSESQANPSPSDSGGLNATSCLAYLRQAFSLQGFSSRAGVVEGKSIPFLPLWEILCSF